MGKLSSFSELAIFDDKVDEINLMTTNTKFKSSHFSNGSNSAKGFHFKKLGRFNNIDVLQSFKKCSSFLKFMHCVELVKLDIGRKKP